MKNLKELESMVDELVKETDKNKQVEKLQGIMAELLLEYAVETEKDFILYPTDVEAYYYNENNFPDDDVHKHELQKNNFGKLYFHRAGGGRTKDNEYKNFHTQSKTGMDVCLSDNENFYFGVLIKKALIKGGEVNYQSHIVGRILGRDKDIAKTPMTDDEKSHLKKLEEKKDISLIASDGGRKGKPEFLVREGVSKNFREEKLKAVLQF